MPWQQIVAGLIVAAAGAYVVWRFRRKKQRRSQGPDVPVSRLTRKRPPSG
jgi:heme/copper-type cytochrome/quinol oxidase subunit 2